MLYLTKWAVCPAGCSDRMVFLQALVTRRVFVFCTACQSGWDRVPSAGSPAYFGPPEFWAPYGVSLPSRADIDKAGWGSAIVTEADESDYDDRLWPVWAYTYIENGDYQKAIAMLDKVIAEHPAPAAAEMLREQAIRRQGPAAEYGQPRL
jgi:hypothetical protein